MENEDIIYEQIYPDVILIGVKHQDIVSRPRKLRNFERTIDGLDHLAFEGNEKIHTLNAEQVRSYESHAFKRFRGEKHFLTPDNARGDILIEQGISPYEILIYETFNFIKGTGRSPTYETVREVLSSLKEIGMHNFSEDEINKGAQTIPPLLLKMKKNEISDIVAGTWRFLEYADKLRDHKLYAPGIEKLRELHGNKGAIFGMDHLPRLKKILQEGETWTSWKEYIETLHDVEKRGVKSIEQIALLNFVYS